MKKLLVPVDGSDSSIRAIKQAMELAELYQGTITLLNVIDIKSATNIFNEERSVELQVKLVEQSDRILNEAKNYCASLGDRVDTVTREGAHAETIVGFADSNDYDLVVMGAHGMSGFKRFFLGSITHKVVSSIEKPILLVR